MMITTQQSSIIGAVLAPLTALPVSLRAPVVVVLLVGAWAVYNVLLSPLSCYPGPVSARLGIPSWRFYHALIGDYAPALHELHKRHGPAVRIGPTHMSFSDPSAVASIYSLSDGTSSRFIKSDFYKSFQVFKTQPSIFSERDPHQHSRRRRAVASAYSMNSLVKLEEYVEDTSELLLQRLETLVEKNAMEDSKDGSMRTTAVQLDRWFHFFAMDVVGELAFGESFNLLRRGKDDERFLTGVANLSQWGAVAGCLPWLSSWILWIFPRITGEPGGSVIGDKTRLRIQTRFADVQESQGMQPRQDMLSKFMEAREPDTRQPYTMQQVLSTASSVMSAGSDTTATALSTVFGYLLDNSRCYEALRAEIDAAMVEGRISTPVKYAKGVQLVYLQACIKEALRLHPPISMDLPRYAPLGGDTLVGNKWPVPPGTTVGISPYVLHRNTDAFGQDAEVFRPERWLEGGNQGRKDLERYNMTFGGGSRACIGKNISLMELSKIIPEILIKFDLRKPALTAVTHSESKGRVNVGTKPSFQGRSAWFLEAHDLFVELIPRA